MGKYRRAVLQRLGQARHPRLRGRSAAHRVAQVTRERDDLSRVGKERWAGRARRYPAFSTARGPAGAAPSALAVFQLLI